jgi:hypothetical protein
MITGVTARFGVSIVSTEAENEIAGHAVLDALAVHVADHDAAILAISFDTALLGAQQIVAIPVIGMTEASLLTACLLGRRFGLISFGQSSRSMYLDLVQRAGLWRRMTGLETIDLSNSSAYLHEGGQDAAVIDASARLIAAGADTIVVAGAGGRRHRTPASCANIRAAAGRNRLRCRPGGDPRAAWATPARRRRAADRRQRDRHRYGTEPASVALSARIRGSICAPLSSQIPLHHSSNTRLACRLPALRRVQSFGFVTGNGWQPCSSTRITGGRRVDNEMHAINISRDDFHGEWDCTKSHQTNSHLEAISPHA